MILSVSRRTDIPSFYFNWFLERLKAREVYMRNPMNFHQVSHINLSPNVVDCIVFWTKNPAPMLGKLKGLDGYDYYVQYTINPYEKDQEGNLPPKKELISTFKNLAEEMGRYPLVWRYSPIILNERYTEEFHLEAFQRLCERLQGSTNQCNISFLEMYRKIQKRMRLLDTEESAEEQKNRLAQKLWAIGEDYGIEVKGCGNLDLETSGIQPAACIDTKIISSITGKHYSLKKDKGQPGDCHCYTSIDIGTYNTCLNVCQYCYANQSTSAATKKNREQYNLHSPILCSSLTEEDKIYDRKVKKEGK